jgi:RNA polymerase sigma-70 factor (ECF subfamily)
MMRALGKAATSGRLPDVRTTTANGRLASIAGGLEEDATLLRAAAAGDEHAVQALYRAHVDRVHRCVARILGPNDSDVEDVIQQVFLAALEGAASFDGRSRVSTWIIGIAMRRALDAARSRHRRARWARVSARVGLGRPELQPDAQLDALSVAQAALAQLSLDQRTVFVLHAVEGYTFNEISEMTGTGISTLHARLKAARARIDAYLAEQGSEGERSS